MENPRASYADYDTLKDKAQWDAVVAGKAPKMNRSPVASEVCSRWYAVRVVYWYDTADHAQVIPVLYALNMSKICCWFVLDSRY